MANELRQLIDTANAPIFGIDVDGDVNEWNEKTAEITGFSKEEAFDKPLVSTFIVPSLRQSVQEVLDNALKGRGTSNYELEFRTKSNEIRYLLVNATTRRDAENNIVGVVGVAQASDWLIVHCCLVCIQVDLFLFSFGISSNFARVIRPTLFESFILIAILFRIESIPSINLSLIQ